MKKYFSVVPLWLSAWLNVVSVLAFSPVWFVVWVFIFGFFSAPTALSQIIGMLIFIAVFSVIIMLNYAVYSSLKKKAESGDDSELKKVNVIFTIISFGITVFVLLIIAYFFIYLS